MLNEVMNRSTADRRYFVFGLPACILWNYKEESTPNLAPSAPTFVPTQDPSCPFKNNIDLIPGNTTEKR